MFATDTPKYFNDPVITNPTPDKINNILGKLDYLRSCDEHVLVEQRSIIINKLDNIVPQVSFVKKPTKEQIINILNKLDNLRNCDKIVKHQIRKKKRRKKIVRKKK